MDQTRLDQSEEKRHSQRILLLVILLFADNPHL